MLALFGGAILIAMIAVTVLSVTGRILDTIGHSDFLAAHIPGAADFFQYFGPILGDFELVEAGMAIAVIAFLPWCSMRRGHATVDIFTANLPLSANRVIDLLWEAVLTIVLAVIAWRLFAGTADKMRYGETTFLLQYPVWWSFAACAVLAVVAALVSLWMTIVRFAEWRGKPAPGISGKG